jgi:GPH family glycoside/pentoside/hexuronide:cation symporter
MTRHRVAHTLSLRAHLYYGALRAPLAWLELPLYVLLPAFYTQTFGVSLGAIGLTLLLARTLDACADPLIGDFFDRSTTPARWRRAILGTLPALALSYAALFFPPQGWSVLLWLGVTVVVTYLAYSVISIAYQAWGTQLGETPADRVRLCAVREAFGLAGVLLAAALLRPEYVPILVAGFGVLAALAAWALARAPLPTVRPTLQPARTADRSQSGWHALWRHGPTRNLLSVFLVNGIANAIPATLMVFYVNDVLECAPCVPWFLIAYFLSAALGMPSWPLLARRLGLRQAWALGMITALLALVAAALLGPGDILPFMVICLVTGWALGADLALPGALLATILAEPDAPEQRAGTVVGLWNLTTKLSLALAAGLALPLVQALGYTPHTPSKPSIALALVYALVPSALKLWAAGFLLTTPLPSTCSKSAPIP